MKRLANPTVIVLIGLVVVFGSVVAVDRLGASRDESDRSRMARQIDRDRERAQIDLVLMQRAGCERSKLDRSANARGWRTAERARRRAYARDHKPEDLDAAKDYREIADELEARSRIDCAKAFPLPAV